ncbi:MAG: flagellar basal body P-ring formation chaperone FlgA [Sphingobium sp.]
MTMMLGSTALAALSPAAHAQPASAPLMEGDVLVRAVSRGEILRAEDFETRAMPAAQLRFALRAEHADGMEARRTLAAGAILRASDVTQPALVRRGDAVVLTLVKGRLKITAPGKALGDGASGEAVRVVNLATSKTIDAHVLARGEVGVVAP